MLHPAHAAASLFMVLTLCACGSTESSQAPNSAASPALSPSMYFNPVQPCSVLSRNQLTQLLGKTARLAGSGTSFMNGQFKSCTWKAASSSKVTVLLAFGVSAVQCKVSEPAAGYMAIPGVGSQAYLGSGVLQAWKGRLLVDLEVSGPATAAVLPATMSSDVNAIFAVMDA